MRKTFEEEIEEKIEIDDEFTDRVDIPTVQFFWQANLFTKRVNKSIPRFLKKIDALKNFSDRELLILSRYLHQRTFSNGDVVFKKDDVGIGFYLLYTGQVNVLKDTLMVCASESVHGTSNVGAEGDSASAGELSGDGLKMQNTIITLESGDYFGELALLQENNIRNATIVAKGSCELLGIFRPDLDDLISEHPKVATRLIQSLSYIVTTRLLSVSRELEKVKAKLSRIEKQMHGYSG